MVVFSKLRVLAAIPVAGCVVVASSILFLGEGANSLALKPDVPAPTKEDVPPVQGAAGDAAGDAAGAADGGAAGGALVSSSPLTQKTMTTRNNKELKQQKIQYYPIFIVYPSGMEAMMMPLDLQGLPGHRPHSGGSSAASGGGGSAVYPASAPASAASSGPVQIDIPTTCTVLDLITILRHQVPNFFQVAWQGRVLSPDDTRPVADLGIGQEASVQLVPG